jgi:hypothetical protein
MATTIWDLVAEAKDLSTANPKHMGILCAVSQCAFPTEDGTLIMPEYCFTLREWRNIANASSEVTQEECIEMFPELGEIDRY